MAIRRVGTVTLGIVLVVFGLIFISRMFITGLSYQFILNLWPVILIMLGIETLIYAFRFKEEKIHYDVGAFIIIFLMSIFSIVMASFEFIIEHELSGIFF